MKKAVSIFILASLFLTGMQAQTSSINYFYHTYKRHEDVRKFSIPGWVIKLGSAVARKHVDEPEAKAALKMAKKVKKLKLLVVEGSNPVKKEDLDRMLNRARSKDGFEDMLFVSEKGTKINMLMRSKKDMIRNLLIVVSESDEFVLVSLKSKITISDLNELLSALEKEVDIDLGVKSGEEQKEQQPEPGKEKKIQKKKSKKDPARA